MDELKRVENEDKLISELKNSDELLEIICKAKDSFDSYQEIMELWVQVDRLVYLIALIALLLFSFSLMVSLPALFTGLFFIVTAVLFMMIITIYFMIKNDAKSWLDFISLDSFNQINDYLHNNKSDVKLVIIDKTKKIILNN